MLQYKVREKPSAYYDSSAVTKKQRATQNLQNKQKQLDDVYRMRENSRYYMCKTINRKPGKGGRNDVRFAVHTCNSKAIQFWPVENNAPATHTHNLTAIC